jgi:uncharacterized protein YjiS (DUF1127 family)
MQQKQLMSAIADHSPSIPTGCSFCTSLVYGMGQSTLSAMREWRVRTRQRRELLMLNDIELNELSLTDADVNREARKPFWEGVEITSR